MIISKNIAKMPQSTPYDINCTISYSAPLEQLFCLNALVDPESHPDCKFWAKDRFSHLSKELQDEVMFFAKHYAKWIFATDVVEHLSVGLTPAECTIANISKLIKEMDPIEFAYIFLGFSAFDHSKTRLADWFADPKSFKPEDLGEQRFFLKTEDVIFFFENSTSIKHRLSWVMEEYWHQSFQYDWEYIEPYMRSFINKEYSKVAQKGAFQYVKEMHPNITFKDGFLTFQKEPDFSINIKNISEVSINLSVFIGSSLAVNIIGSKLYLTKNLGFQSAITASPVPTDLVNITKACSDETRLKMLKIFWNGQATTQSLSEILHLSPSAISLHIKQLKAANLIDSYKDGKFVYYYINASAIQGIHQILISYLKK